MFSKQVVIDPGSEQWVHMSYCSPNKVREMVTHLGTNLFKRMYVAKMCWKPKQTLFKVFKLSQIDDKS